MPFLLAREPSPATFDLHVSLASPIGIKEVGSHTHVVDVQRDSGTSDRVDIALAQGHIATDHEFILDYRLAADAIESGVLLHKVTVEREAFDLVSRNLGRANLFAFGIGSSVNRALIEGLARAGQGEPFIVTQSTEAAAQAERFRKMIDAPVLTQVKLRFEGGEDFNAHDVEPAAIGDLFASRPVIVFGKWKGKPSGWLVIEGLTANGNFRSSVDLAGEEKKGTSEPALRYLWARHRIAALSDQEVLEGSGIAAKVITDLGLRYSLLTQDTSFIAVDRLVRSLTPGQTVAVDQPLPMPQGGSNLAIGAEVPATPEPPAFAMLLVALGVIALVMRRARANVGRGA